MKALNNNYGIIISLIIHIFILAIPVSITLSRNLKEVDLFFIDERVIEPDIKKILKEPQKKDNSISLEKEQSVSEVFEPMVKNVEDVPNKINEVIEPVVESRNENSDISIQPAPVPSMPVSIESPQPAVKAKTFEDVEFGSVSGPNFNHREMPVYPTMARRLGKEGRVLLRLTIDEKGRLLNVEVIEDGGFGFTEAAIEAVKKSTFFPAFKDGKPVISRALLPIRFALRRAE